MCDILASTHGEGELRHSNGALSTVRIEAARMSTKNVRSTNISPEVPDIVTKMVLE
jgi:hypothetical protein